jgi:homoserine O-acetyltransferase/O-succinyltransferase
MQPRQWLERETAIGDLALQGGETLRDTRIRWLQSGQPNAPKDNIVLLPTYYGGAMAGNRALGAGDSPLADPHWCLLIPAMLGGGESTSPSNAQAGQRGLQFPQITLADQVRAQARLLEQEFGAFELALVAGWSLGGMQSLQWACLYPERVRRVAAWCSAARCHPHNLLFLLGLEAALLADPLAHGDDKPERGLRAFGRVYASRAYAPRFVADALYRELGFADLAQLLQWWEDDHLAMNHHDLLLVLRMWAQADIAANERFNGDHDAALRAITAPALLMPCATDQYFLVHESQAEAARMPRADFRILDSHWGHCGGGPGREAAAMAQLWQALRELLAR